MTPMAQASPCAEDDDVDATSESRAMLAAPRLVHVFQRDSVVKDAIGLFVAPGK